MHALSLNLRVSRDAPHLADAPIFESDACLFCRLPFWSVSPAAPLLG